MKIEMTRLNPALCMQVRYSSVINLQTNLYQASLTVTAQRYPTGSYNGLNIIPGMYVTCGNSGYIFKINSIVSTFRPITPTKTNVVVVLEDVNGYNATIDISSGILGGGPTLNSFGYVFELDDYGLPTSWDVVSHFSGYRFGDTGATGTLLVSGYSNILAYGFGGSTGTSGGGTGYTGPTGSE